MVGASNIAPLMAGASPPRGECGEGTPFYGEGPAGGAVGGGGGTLSSCLRRRQARKKRRSNAATTISTAIHSHGTDVVLPLGLVGDVPLGANATVTLTEEPVIEKEPPTVVQFFQLVAAAY